jgi:hypothetical protein
MKNKTPQIFKAAKCVQFCENEEHKTMPLDDLKYSSCCCSLTRNGCYCIVSDGQGLGLIADTKEEAERISDVMNIAWDLAKNGY